MVSIIKNQLLKHLSRFTKNLSADKVNLSTFKGEGELSNLELNESVLTELLELPSWLRLSSAVCNKVVFRIPWTKLKSVPIHLSLDTVNITCETCEDLRQMSPQHGLSSYIGSPGKYSFIHKVIDGITVTVNTVVITFQSPAFTATIQIYRILVESKDQYWNKADLRLTRLKDPEKGQLLIFKELTWESVKLEATSRRDSSLAPLRLLTERSWCRVVIKKRISDCNVLGSRLVLILGEFLWILTDSQLVAALHFADSVADLIQKSTKLTRTKKAARKLEELPEYQTQVAAQQQVKTKGPTLKAKISQFFERYNFIETSYHFFCQHLILQLCDESGPGRSCHPTLKNGSVLEVNVKGFQVDYYPYHLARSDRKHWPMYRQASIPHSHWQNQSLDNFLARFLDLVERNKALHVPLGRLNKEPKMDQDHVPTSPNFSHGRNVMDPLQVKNYIRGQFSRLMTACVIIRIEDFTVDKVATCAKRRGQKEFITGNRDLMTLPEEASIIHAEFIYFYYPDDSPFPLPPPKFYVQVNPIQVVFDVDSCLWFNSFLLNLQQSLKHSKQDINMTDITYIDVKIEAILFKVLFESDVEYHSQQNRPKTLTFQVTRATVTNVRSIEQSSRADLAKCVDSFHMGSLFFGSDFPSDSSDFYIVTQKFLDHISAKDNIRNLPSELDTTSINNMIEKLSREMLWTDAKDVWSIQLDPVWGDFTGSPGTGKPVPFLDALPITVWVHTSLDPNSTIRLAENGPKNAEIHALAHVSNLISFQIDHFQLLFLLRLAEKVSELTTYITLDSKRVFKADNSGNNGTVAVGALLPQVEVTFVMPSLTLGKESSGVDLESFIPDSSSIVDDLHFGGSTSTMWQTEELGRKLDTIQCNWASSNSVDKSPRPSSQIVTQGYSSTMWQAEELGRKLDTIQCNRASSNSVDKSPRSSSKIVAQDRHPLMEDFQEDFQVVANETSVNWYGPGSAEFKQAEVKVSSKNSAQPFSNINLSNNFNEGFSSMKKGFSNLMTSLDSALKSSPDDVSDTVSTRSDASSDSDNTEIMKCNNFGETESLDSMFFVPNLKRNPVEQASEVLEEENTVTTTSDHSHASSYKRKGVVSLATFKLNKVEFIQQSVGYSSSIKLQVGDITCGDCGSISWEEFQTKFGSRSRAWMNNLCAETTSAKVKLRLDHGLKPASYHSLLEMDVIDAAKLKKVFTDYVKILVANLDMELSMSTIAGLAELVEDEVTPIPIPVDITLNDVKLCINEDRISSLNTASNGPPPVHLTVSQLYITRGEDGVFNIQPLKNSSLEPLSPTSGAESSANPQSQTSQQLKRDNEELVRRLAAFERLSEENRLLRKDNEESGALRTCLAAAQDEVFRLLEANAKLLETIRALKAQAGSSDRNHHVANKR